MSITAGELSLSAASQLEDPLIRLPIGTAVIAVSRYGPPVGPQDIRGLGRLGHRRGVLEVLHQPPGECVFFIFNDSSFEANELDSP